jgi:hypothetical protein
MAEGRFSFHMPDDIHNDETMFDRLVDGELSEAERRRLLASLDERPDDWRKCALAFLEAQSWKGDLGQLVRESAPAPHGDLSATPAPLSRELLRHALPWLAIAASVIVAFTLGLMQRDVEHPIAAVPPEIPSAQATSDPDALTLWVRDDRGQAQPLRVPLVDAGTIDRELGVTFQSAIPAGTRERLQQRGYDLQSKRRYAPLWLENGRPMIVPVEDTKIVPVGQNVY